MDIRGKKMLEFRKRGAGKWRMVLGGMGIALMALRLPAPAGAGSFVINEIVADPQQDWGQSSGGSGTPFDGVPGDGARGDTDEYIEIKNISGTAAALSGYTLIMDDGTAAEDTFGGSGSNALHYRIFDSAGTLVGSDPAVAVPAGGYLVLGNPSGALGVSAVLTVTLFDTSQQVVEIVTVPANGANAGSVADEAYSRFPDGDPDPNAAFVLRSATLGRSNGSYCQIATGEAVINEVVGDPMSNWDRSDDAGVIPGGETPFNGTAAATGKISEPDEYVELKNVSVGSLDFTGCVLDMLDSASGSESFLMTGTDAPADPWIRVFDSAGTLLGTAPKLASVPAGGYVLVGNPPGGMNLGSSSSPTVLVLRNGPAAARAATDIDRVSFGSDAPNLNASGPGDEAIGRFPDGRDTGVGADDFMAGAGTPGRSNGDGSPALPGEVVINEVVIVPGKDYNQSGAITGSDQLLEFLNKSGRTLDLTGWRLKMIDTTPASQPLDSAEAITFSDPNDPNASSFTAWRNGVYMVVLNPSGEMNSDVYVQLLDLEGTLVDDVEIGGNTRNKDYEGDGPGDGAPESGDNAKAYGLGDTGIAREPDGVDTNNDIADFLKQEPTLAQEFPPVGASNTIDRSGDTTGPGLNLGATTSGTGFPVSGEAVIAFTEPVATTAVSDLLVYLQPSGSGGPPEGFTTILSFIRGGDDDEILLRPLGALDYSTSYDIVVVAGITDRAGNAATFTGVVSSFTTEGPPTQPGSVVLNEVVSDPQRDWKGTGFADPNAPQGSNASSDEWIELYNRSGGAVSNLSAWTLTMLDRSRAETLLGDFADGHSVTCFSSAGVPEAGTGCLTTLAAGAYLVIGDPPGSLSNDIYLELRDGAGSVVDSVEIGGNTAATDFGGDGVDNGAPGPGADGDAKGLFDEVMARVPNGSDTGQDATDWVQQAATLGKSNAVGPAPNDGAPELVSFVPSQTLGGGTGRWRVDTDLVLTFTEPIDPASVDSTTVTLASGGDKVSLGFDFAANETELTLSFARGLLFGRIYTLTLLGGAGGVADRSGQPLDGNTVRQLTTETAPSSPASVVINEVVTDPQHDWNDSVYQQGAPFDADARDYIATSGDEWIELYNRSPSTVDLTGYVLVMKDSDYQGYTIAGGRAASEHYTAGSGSGVLASDGYMVLGDPTGTLSDDIFVALRRSDGTLVDAVLVDGAADTTADEAFARLPNGSDTGVDRQDFGKTTATILGENIGPAPAEPVRPGEVLITEVNVDPKSDWNDSTQDPTNNPGVPFDPNAATGADIDITSSDEYVEIANVSGRTLDLTGWTLVMVDSSPTLYSIGASSAVEYFFGTGCTIDAFADACILVVGNPSGTLNNDVYVALLDPAGEVIDKVEIGGRSATNNYEADDDYDGEVDEDPVDGEDTDGDGLVDEDPENPDEPPGDGIPAGGNGKSIGIFDEAFLRVARTGVDQQDWIRGFGKPGQADLDPIRPVPMNAVPRIVWLLLFFLLAGGAVLRIRRRSTRGTSP